MICFPNAKINLGLNIVSKRSDGYHNLETIFYPLPITDALEIIVRRQQSEDTFVEAGIKIDTTPATNLVMKALTLMRTRYEFPAVEVHLLKKIPFGAGLGGGSADASFMLKLIDTTFALGVSDEMLAELAIQLGADCPFFIYNKPLFATGIGELFKAIDISLKSYYFVLIKPPIHVATKDAFTNIKPTQPPLALSEIIKYPIIEWKHWMKNDFENSVFAQYPAIETIKNTLYEQGALYASLSGSGSSVYGIFDEEIANLTCLFPNYFVWQGQGL